ncbi:uncharacterized protein LOC142977705 [Anticarsia gemmatalis]|uniref:uncharacterized protein LOC142977705 n=1 Tax=Anticarsia gemmatalis TaxID=129554 RepID=UPI003F76E746
MPVRKISRCHPDFIDIIYKLAATYCLDITEYIVQFGCDDVDSFAGGIHKVTLTGLQNGQKIKRPILIKWHPDAKSRATFREAYRREIIYYRNIVPKLLEIQRAFKNIEGLKMKFPNCIFTSAEYDKEAIALQGIYENGFRFRNRFHPMDFTHAVLVMKDLGKLHALSFALAKKYPVEYEEISAMCSKDVQYSVAGPVPNSMKGFYDASVAVVQDSNIKRKLKELGPHILTVLHKCTLADSFSTICHGDCWTNNIAYKYQGDRPFEVLFTDSQLTRIASPVTDISYFLYMSTDKRFLDNHYSRILNVYYGTLTAVLRQCNLDVNEIYPPSVFQKHLKEYSVLGLIEALVSMMIITAQSEEALKMTEMKYEFCDEKLREDEHSDSSLFIDRVNGVVSDFFERGYSLDAILNK